MWGSPAFYRQKYQVISFRILRINFVSDDIIIAGDFLFVNNYLSFIIKFIILYIKCMVMNVRFYIFITIIFYRLS